MKPAFFDLGEMPGTRTDTHAKDGTPLHPSCTCYPHNPEYRHGCNHENQCWVLGNARRGNTARRAGQKAETPEAPHNPESPAEHAMRRLARAGVPVDSLETARKPRTTKALAAAESWWAGDKGAKPALVLAGPAGCGKSVASAWAALRWGEEWPWNSLPSGPQRPAFVWLGGLALRQIGGFDATAALVLDNAEAAHLLAIDDAAREGTAKAIQALSDVVQARCDRRRLTILTTNTDGAAFRQRYGNALADRLRGCSVAPDLRNEVSLRRQA